MLPFKKYRVLCYSLATAVIASGCSGGGVATSNLPAAQSMPQSDTQSGFDHTLGSSVRSLSVGSSAYANTIASDTPLAYYHLNDLGPALNDAGPNHENGTYGSSVQHGGPPLTSTGDLSPTFPGGSYDTTMFASAPVAAFMQPQQSVTVEAWINSAANNITRTYLPIVAYGKQSEGPAYTLMISPQNVLQFNANTTAKGGIALQGYTNIQPGVTYHVVATYDGTAATIYLNGSLEASKAASGQLVYQYLNKFDGLGIGGSLDRGRPQFAGSISEVAIYGRALSQADLQAHYVAGVRPAVLVERARSTANLVDIMGVNTHFHYQNTTYDTQYPKLKQLLVDLGVRHIRDGLVDTSFKPYFDRLNELGKLGIRSTLNAYFDETASFLTSYPSRIPASFEAYEPPNEPDVHPVGNWVANTQAFQKMMYTAVKSNPATAQYRVFGPSPENLQDFEAVGDLSQYMDIGNFHLYQPGLNPGTDGYGSRSQYGINGSIDWSMNVARIVDGQHQIAATEMGYNYAPGVIKNLPPAAGATYLPRLFLEAFNRHLSRVFIYQFADFETVPTFTEGLVSQNMVPKAPYYAMKSLIGLMRDQHPNPTPSMLSYTLTGNLANVHHTLLQRGDGSFELALWIETRSNTPTFSAPDGTRINVPTQNITLSLPSQPLSMQLQAFDEAGNVTTSSPASFGISTQIPVRDAVTFVHFTL